MKLFVILFIVAPMMGALAITPEERAAKIKAHHKECLKVSKLDPQELAKAREGSIDESNTALREHILCFVKRVKLMSEAGELQEDVIKTKLTQALKDEGAFKDEDTIEKVVKLCDSIKKPDDTALYATQVISCFYKNIPGLKIM